MVLIMAYPSLEFVIANTLAISKKLEPKSRVYKLHVESSINKLFCI